MEGIQILYSILQARDFPSDLTYSLEEQLKHLSDNCLQKKQITRDEEESIHIKGMNKGI